MQLGSKATLPLAAAFTDTSSGGAGILALHPSSMMMQSFCKAFQRRLLRFFGSLARRTFGKL